MRKVYLSAGHSNTKGRDMGAVGNGYVEGIEAVELRNIIFSELKKLGLIAIMDSDNSILADTIKFFKNLTEKNAIVIDIHFNAGTEKATGTETLVPFDATIFEKELADDLTKTMSEVLAIKSRGVKSEADSHHGRLGFFRLTGENVLLEVCFISNKSDMESYKKNRFVLGEKLARIIYDFAQKENTTQEKIHIVQKGDSLSKIATTYRTTIIKIKADNNLQSDIIQIGQKLKI